MSWKLIEKQRRLVADEIGTVVKDPGGKTTVVLVYPNTYRVGMSNLAVHALYQQLNDHPAIACERAFLPDKGDIEEHHRTNTPVLSIENQRPLGEFDVIAFTCSFENDLLNIISILELSKIKYRKEDRTDDDPLIIAGGAAVSLNPMPLAHIVDACIPGEFEAYGGDLIEGLTAGDWATYENLSSKNKTGVSHRTPLRGVGEQTPPLKFSHTKPAGADINAFPTQTVIWTPHTEFGNMHLIEMMRGCPRGCAFCATPGLYAPFRMRSYDSIIAMIENGFQHRTKFGLIGAEIVAHPRFTDIAEHILSHGGSFSLSSVRIDRINPNLVQLFMRAGMRSLSLGIEAATEYLRKLLRKTFTDERCREAVAILAREGITNLRLYFMIGLPGETDEDITAIPAFAEDMLETIRKHAPRTRRSSSVELSLAPFVPKHHSPFEDKTFVGVKRINDIQKQLKKLVGKNRDIKLNFDSAQQAAIEAYLAKAGPEAIEFLEKAHRTSPRKALSLLAP